MVPSKTSIRSIGARVVALRLTGASFSEIQRKFFPGVDYWTLWQRARAVDPELSQRVHCRKALGGGPLRRKPHIRPNARGDKNWQRRRKAKAINEPQTDDDLFEI